MRLSSWSRLLILQQSGHTYLRSSLGEVLFFGISLVLWGFALASYEGLFLQTLLPAFFWFFLFFLLVFSLEPWLYFEQQEGFLELLWLYPLSTHHIFLLLVLRQSVQRLPLLLVASGMAGLSMGGLTLGSFSGLFLTALLGVLGGTFIGLLMGVLKQTGSQTKGHFLLILLALPFYLPLFILGLAGWEVCAIYQFPWAPCLGLLGFLGLNGLLCTTFGGLMLKQHL
jgi:ABC-type transport system involved in cytochrome c biogenesis permease component